MKRCAGRTVPDGRSCARRRASRKPCRTLRLLVVAVYGASSAGCSFVFTKGPQPEVQPPPPCTTDNTYPIADSVIAAASAAAVIAGSVLLAGAAGQHPCGDSCWTEGVTGAGALIVAVPLVAVFTPSAIVGFNRTADCRAWLQENPQYAPQPAPSTSSSLLVPARTCAVQGDAPLLCSS